MNLYSKRFEKTLRRGIKQAIASSPDLRREFKRVNKRGLPSWIAWFGVIPLLGIPSILCFTTTVSTGRAAAPLAVLTLASAFLIAVAAPGFALHFTGGRGTWRFFMSPVAEDEIVRWVVRRFVRGHFLLFLCFLAGLGAIARALHFSFWQCLGALPIALLATGTHLAWIIHAAARLPRAFGAYLFLGVIVTGFAIAAGWTWQGAAVAAFVFRHAGVCNLLLPTGWALSFFELLTPQRNWLDLAFIAPLAFLFSTVPASLRVLRRHFGYREVVLPSAVDVPLRRGGALSSAVVQPQPLAGETEITDAILSRQLLVPASGLGTGLLERFYWRLLNDRERALTEFVFPNGLNLGKWWRRAWVLMSLAAAIAFLAWRRYNDGISILCILFGFGASGVAMFVAFATSGRAFQKAWGGSLMAPMYAVLGLSYSEISRLLWKCSLAQFPALFLWTIAGALFTTWLSHSHTPAIFPI